MGTRTIGLFLSMFALELAARPISYSGGSTVMAFSNNMQDSLYYHYSPNHRLSLGVEAVNDKYTDQNYAYWRATYLLNRKNSQHSQRNVYLEAGISSQGSNQGFASVHYDWETRRWFSGFGVKRVSDHATDYSETFFKVGIAPYLGEYGDLHTWLLLKRKRDTRLEHWLTYPVLRFFKGNFFIEMGYKSEIEWDTHLMFRF